jgi:predicted helicase
VKGESDPNREDDPGYIVRLVGKVVRVSVETVQIVRSLPNYR